MNTKIYILTEDKRWGVKILLDWAVGEYKKAQTNKGKQMWKNRISFLEDLQRQTHYAQAERVFYNKLRAQYLQKFT